MQLPFLSEAKQVGFVMVKPHAFDAVLDPLISETLAGNGLAGQLAADDQLRSVLNRLRIGNPIIRNLATLSYGSKFIELLYSEKSTRRYYPLIQKYYLGKIAIIPYLYNGSPADMSVVYAALKGTTETYDAYGKQIDEPKGLRGLYGEPYQFYDDQSSFTMDDATYRRHFTPVVNNFIHISDSDAEISAGFKLVCREDEWEAAYRHIL